MAWYEVMGYLLGGSGIVGGIYSIFTMRVKKEGMVIENLKQVIDEVKEHHIEYKKETDEKFDKIEKKVAKMELKDELQTAAINKGYRCPFPPRDKNCPVTEIIDRSCKILTDQMNKFNQNKE